MNPRRPYFKLLYNGKDITEDISRYLISAKVVDKAITDSKKNESDELDIVLEDTDQVWIDDWMPSKGDLLNVELGYTDNFLSFGDFEIDEITYDGPPSRISIKAMAAGISRQIRTKRSTAHEGKSLKEIANKIAEAHGLTVEGEISDIRIERKTQDRETDLAFLARIADEYGYMYSIRGTKIIFTAVYDIHKADNVGEIDLTEMISWSVKDSAASTASSATVSYHDPNTNSLVDFTMEAGGEFNFGVVEPKNVQEAIQQTTVANDVTKNVVLGAVYKSVVEKTGLKPDQIQLRTRAENVQQAEAKAKSALHKANSRQVTISVKVPGNPRFMAGANVEITGLRKLSGKYNIEKVEHSFSTNGGYENDIDGKKVGGLSDISKQAPLNQRNNGVISVQ